MAEKGHQLIGGDNDDLCSSALTARQLTSLGNIANRLEADERIRSGEFEIAVGDMDMIVHVGHDESGTFGILGAWLEREDV